MTLAVSFKSTDQLVSERLVGVHDAWKRTAGQRMAPKREEITPSLLRTALPWIWMIDVIDGGKDFRFRIAGERVIEFMGRRYAGELLSHHLDNPFFQRMHAILSECLRRKNPVAAGPVRPDVTGKEFFEMEVVVMPLSEDGDLVTTLFGALDLRVLPRFSQ
ncbi:MAG: PAS domain-containing protein [Rhizomicrobium sp.]